MHQNANGASSTNRLRCDATKQKSLMSSYVDYQECLLHASTTFSDPLLRRLRTDISGQMSCAHTYTRIIAASAKTINIYDSVNVANNAKLMLHHVIAVVKAPWTFSLAVLSVSLFSDNNWTHFFQFPAWDSRGHFSKHCFVSDCLRILRSKFTGIPTNT